MNWHYIDNDRQVGPVDEMRIPELVKSGTFTKSTRVWREGMTDWAAAINTELAKYLMVAPPPFRSVTPPPTYSGVQPEYLRRPEVLRTMWLWWIILCAVGYPLCFVFFIGIPFIIVGAVIGYILLYRFWFLIQSGTPRTTPSKAVGYCFIPFYNFYWWYVAFVGLAKDMNAFCREKDVAAKVDEGMALTYFILMLTTMIPFVGFVTAIGGLVVGAIMQKQFVEASIAIINAKKT